MPLKMSRMNECPLASLSLDHTLAGGESCGQPSLGGLDLTSPRAEWEAGCGSGFSPRVLAMSADPLSEQEGVEEKQQADEMGPDASCTIPLLFLTCTQLSIPFTGGLFLSRLPWLRLRELSEAQGRDKGLAYPQDCSCWLGQGQSGKPAIVSPHRYKPDTGYLHPQALEREAGFGEKQMTEERRPSISDKPSATVVRL